MTAEDIAKLRGLLERATSGEWVVIHGTEVATRSHGVADASPCCDDDDGEANAALIAAMRNALPSLLDEHERAMAVVRAVAGIKEAPVCDLCGRTYWKQHAPNCAWVAAREMVVDVPATTVQDVPDESTK
jgi:hypothetical protein